MATNNIHGGTEEFFRTNSIERCKEIIAGSKKCGLNYYSLKDGQYWPKHCVGNKSDVDCFTLAMLVHGTNENGKYDMQSIHQFISTLEVPAPLPKHWEPSKEYVEISRGIGIDYQERIVPKYDVKSWIHAGWSITRLSKISPAMVKTKWINAIIAMEKQHECSN